jgi:hypothetical protein
MENAYRGMGHQAAAREFIILIEKVKQTWGSWPERFSASGGN